NPDQVICAAHYSMRFNQHDVDQIQHLFQVCTEFSDSFNDKKLRRILRPLSDYKPKRAELLPALEYGPIHYAIFKVATEICRCVQNLLIAWLDEFPLNLKEMVQQSEIPHPNLTSLRNHHMKSIVLAKLDITVIGLMHRVRVEVEKLLEFQLRQYQLDVTPALYFSFLREYIKNIVAVDAYKYIE
ncbi:hypothetical protein BVRB_025520, partial [Beta vulgaris subsp. vulgaris]